MYKYFYGLYLCLILTLVFARHVSATDISLTWKDEQYSNISLKSGDIYDIKSTFDIYPQTEEVYYEIYNLDNPYAFLISDEGVMVVSSSLKETSCIIFIKSITDNSQYLTLNVDINKISTPSDEEVNSVGIEDDSDSEDDETIDNTLDSILDADYWREFYNNAAKKSKLLLSGFTSDIDDEEEDYDGYQIEIFDAPIEEITASNIKISKAKISSVKNKKKQKIKIKFSDLDNATHYQIDISNNADFKGFTRYNITKTSYTLKELTLNKKYYIRVRGANFDNKKAIYGKFSKVKSIKIKK